MGRRRNHGHPGGLILDCRHWRKYVETVKVGDRKYCAKCRELHAVMFVIKPRWLPKENPNPGQLSLDDIPPF